MYHRLLLSFIFGSMLSMGSYSQENDSLTIEDYYQNMFDSTLTESQFLESVNGFLGSISPSTKESKEWHRGQTDYVEVFFEDSIQTFSSVTHFNSFRSPLYASQLLYRGKVIRKVRAGAEDMSQSMHRSISLVPIPPKKRTRRRTEKKTDESLQIDFAQEELKLEEVKPRIYNETFYNHALNLEVTFSAMCDTVRSEILVIKIIHDRNTLELKRNFSRLISVYYNKIDDDQLPYVFIENH